MIIRRATLEDWKAIQDTEWNVYSGHDYLPFVLDMWLRDDKRHTYIMLEAGRVAALDSVVHNRFVACLSAHP